MSKKNLLTAKTAYESVSFQLLGETEVGLELDVKLLALEEETAESEDRDMKCVILSWVRDRFDIFLKNIGSFQKKQQNLDTS